MRPQKVLTVFFCMAGVVLVCLAPVMHRIVTSRGHDTPIVVNTWAFKDATEAAWAVLASTDSASSALDAVEQVRHEHQLDSKFCAVMAATGWHISREALLARRAAALVRTCSVT